MTARSTVAFAVRRWAGGGVEVDPVVDGVALGERIDTDLAGRLLGSAAQVPALRSDLLGGGATWGRSGYAELMTCGCGVPEDDLLAALVVVGDGAGAGVEWRDLQQQTRPPTTYRAFGPYRFDRAAYTVAVDAACAEAADLLDRRR